ncbi:DUF1127 domain-containing protein [Devosia sp.]|uniref:DUF1127 domain-containing protein n=1 Tax=Devosia sp. TaxID=1871048 RepID=UPI001AD1A38A|nr:DUF1127 domain-containing protein [Devosia sp.]MBN9309914.1 DUF1127 domain-containing protein [Devosia sp.]
MTSIDIEDHLTPATARSARPGPFRRWLASWRQRRLQRITLAELGRMDGYLLRDMGIEPQDVIDALEGRNRSLLFNPVRPGE